MASRGPSPPARPRLADVAAAYDVGVAAYDALWSPIIVPSARAVVAALEFEGTPRVLDLGAGTGALIQPIREAAPSAAVVALDASVQMLVVARTRAGVPAVRGDALSLPIGDNTIDAVLAAFVLFHLADPAAALAEAGRVLRGGGRIGTVTWAREKASKAHAVWDETLAEADVPPAPQRRVDAGLDSPEAIGSLLTEAGLPPRRIWIEPLSHQWERGDFWQLVTGSGVNRLRLAGVEEPVRGEVLARARERLDSLDPQDFAWWGEVVCAVGTKPPDRIR